MNYLLSQHILRVSIKNKLNSCMIQFDSVCVGHPDPHRFSQVLLIILALDNTWHCVLSLEDDGYY